MMGASVNRAPDVLAIAPSVNEKMGVNQAVNLHCQIASFFEAIVSHTESGLFLRKRRQRLKDSFRSPKVPRFGTMRRTT